MKSKWRGRLVLLLAAALGPMAVVSVAVAAPRSGHAATQKRRALRVPLNVGAILERGITGKTSTRGRR
jgi:hypothetical protein